MKKERNIKRKQQLIRLSLLNRKTKTCRIISVQLVFGCAGVSTIRSQKRMVKKLTTETGMLKGVAKRDMVTMSVSDKISLGYRVYQHIQNNPDFAFIAPAPNVLRIAVEALHDASFNYKNGGRAMEREILAAKEESFDDVFRAILSYIDWIAKGSEEVYRSAGLAGRS